MGQVCRLGDRRKTEAIRDGGPDGQAGLRVVEEEG